MQKKYFLLLLSCFFLLNCSKKEEVANVPYIISKDKNNYTKRHVNGRLVPPPPPPPISYGSSNIIIDTKGDLYYYQKTYYALWNCVPEKNPLPEFINLQPKDLIKLPTNSIENILNENTLEKIKNKKGLLIIASQLDTLKNDSFFSIMHFLKQNNISLYLIRRTTQEEDVVLKFKKNDLYYDVDSIQWDKSRIKFYK